MAEHTQTDVKTKSSINVERQKNGRNAEKRQNQTIISVNNYTKLKNNNMDSSKIQGWTTKEFPFLVWHMACYRGQW